ncbi:hypothetical protein [Desulfobacter sp.]|uniref:hypothetical protein n=1 Tax=Desulfobacter sp. TaxID=2294 RepID=UPI003D0E0223
MPKIPIKDIGSTKTNLIIQGLMYCYPDLDLLEKFSALFLAGTYKKVSLKYPDKIADILMENGFNGGPGHDEMMGKVIPNRTRKAAIAGDILKYLYILDYDGKESPSLYKARQKVNFSYKRASDENKARGVGWSEKFLKDAWREYKAIAPLWAALRCLPEGVSPFHNLLISCSPGKDIHDYTYFMRLFLGMAESFSNFGEKLMLHNKTTNKKEPLFQPDEVWRVPERFKDKLSIGRLHPPK